MCAVEAFIAGINGNDKPLLQLEELRAQHVFTSLLSDYLLARIPLVYRPLTLSYLKRLLRRRTVTVPICKQALTELLSLVGIEPSCLEFHCDLCALLSRRSGLSAEDWSGVAARMLEEPPKSETALICERMLIDLYQRPSQRDLQIQLLGPIGTRAGEDALLTHFFGFATAVVMSKMYCKNQQIMKVPHYVQALTARLLADPHRRDIESEDIVCRLVGEYSSEYLRTDSPIGLTPQVVAELIIGTDYRAHQLSAEFRVSLLVCFVHACPNCREQLPDAVLQASVAYLKGDEALLIESVEDMLLSLQLNATNEILPPTEAALEIISAPICHY